MQGPDDGGTVGGDENARDDDGDGEDEDEEEEDEDDG